VQALIRDINCSHDRFRPDFQQQTGSLAQTVQPSVAPTPVSGVVGAGAVTLPAGGAASGRRARPAGSSARAAYCGPGGPGSTIEQEPLFRPRSFETKGPGNEWALPGSFTRPRSRRLGRNSARRLAGAVRMLEAE
jgi:hypothetical protein